MLTIHHLNRILIHRKCGSQRGVSLVELMIGMTVGLVIVAGVISLYANNIGQSSRVAINARVEQDLRNAADLITRDLRRAGYWGNSIQGTIAVGTTAVTTPNPYIAVDPTAHATNGQVLYNFSRDTTEDNSRGDSEIFGFRRNSTDNTVEMQTASGTWVALNDPGYTLITAVNLANTSPDAIPLGYRCPKACAAGSANCPIMKVRRYDLVLTGQSALDSTVIRTLRTRIRVRNDQMSGVCPV